MNPKLPGKDWENGRHSVAFTLLELLVVLGIIGLLAALLMPALAQGMAKSRKIACVNGLKQIGLSMAMYVEDSHRYPPAWDRLGDRTWMEYLTPNAPFSWTNRSWHCPVYLAQHGIVTRDLAPQQRFFTSYSYNAKGIVGDEQQAPGNPRLQLGLGWRTTAAASEPEVLDPSSMYAVADARAVPAAVSGSQSVGFLTMTPYFLAANEKPPTHEQGYNVLFAEGHVCGVKRDNFLFPPRTAANWNRDNQPHPEVWAAKSQWVVRK